MLGDSFLLDGKNKVISGRVQRLNPVEVASKTFGHIVKIVLRILGKYTWKTIGQEE